METPVISYRPTPAPPTLQALRDTRAKLDLMATHRPRDQYIRDFGFTVVTQELIDTLTTLLQKQSVLEIGAGTGYLAALLQQRDIDITPTDVETCHWTRHWGNLKLHPEQRYCQVHELDVSTLHANRVLISQDVTLLCWPDYNCDVALQTAQSIQRGHDLYYLGESQGGCTGNDAFFDYLEDNFTVIDDATQSLNRTYEQWLGIHDRWTVYRRL